MPAEPYYPIADRLPNGSVGKPYEAPFQALFHSEAHYSAVERMQVTVPPDCGLTYDEATQTLKGTPSISGELEVEVMVVPRVTKKIAITINPDPASLWKDLPSDAHGQFAKGDTYIRSLDTPHLCALAASLRGRSHAHEGKYREDDFRMKHMPGSDWHLFAVADGAGSAEFSRRGSQLACEHALSYLEQKLESDNTLARAIEERVATGQPTADDTLRKVLYDYLVMAAYEGAKTVTQEARNYKKETRDFATTLLLAIAKPVSTGWFIGGFAVGDGGAGVLVNDNALLPLTKPDSGDFGGQTVFLTSPKVFGATEGDSLFARVQAGFAPTFLCLGLMTDGVSDPKFQSDANLASPEVWSNLRKELSSVLNVDTPAPGMEKELLEWMKFHSAGNHDDRTLIIAVPKTSPQK